MPKNMDTGSDGRANLIVLFPLAQRFINALLRIYTHYRGTCIALYAPCQAGTGTVARIDGSTK